MYNWVCCFSSFLFCAIAADAQHPPCWFTASLQAQLPFQTTALFLNIVLLLTNFLPTHITLHYNINLDVRVTNHQPGYRWFEVIFYVLNKSAKERYPGKYRFKKSNTQLKLRRFSQFIPYWVKICQPFTILWTYF